MRILLQGSINEQNMIDGFVDTIYPDSSSREKANIPTTINELFIKFHLLNIECTTLANGSMQLDITPSPNQTNAEFDQRIGELSILLNSLKTASDKLVIITYYKNYSIFQQLQQLPKEIPGLEKLEITRRSNTPLKLGEILIPSDITHEAILDFFFRIAAEKTRVGDDIFDGDKVLANSPQKLQSKKQSAKTDTSTKAKSTRPNSDDNLQDPSAISDTDASSVSSLGTEPPSPPKSGRPQDESTDSESTADIYLEEETVLPKQGKPEPIIYKSDSSQDLTDDEESSSASSTVVEKFYDSEDNYLNVTKKSYNYRQSIQTTAASICRQMYIDSAETFNSYLQADDIKVLEYFVAETEDRMSMLDELMWTRVAEALAKLDNLQSGILSEPATTREECINEFNDAINTRRIEYNALYTKKPAATHISEEAIQASIKQKEQTEEQELLKSMRVLLHSDEDLALFDKIVLANQEDQTVTEEGWNRLKQFFELRDVVDEWPKIRDKLIQSNLSATDWQAIDKFFITVEQEKDQELLENILSLLNDDEAVASIFRPLLDANQDDYASFRQDDRDEIWRFCEYVSNNYERWSEFKQELLKSETTAEIWKEIDKALLEDQQIEAAKQRQEVVDRLIEARMTPIPRSSDAIIATGLYKLQREELVKKLDQRTIEILDQFLTHPALDDTLFTHFWERTNFLLKEYLTAENQKGDQRDESKVSATKQRFEDHLAASYARDLSKFPSYKSNEIATSLKNLKPLTCLLISTYIFMKSIIQNSIETEYLEKIITRIIISGDDSFISADEVNNLYSQLLGASSIKTPEQKASIEEYIGEVYFYNIHIRDISPVASDALKSLDEYINRVSKEPYIAGNDFHFFKDSRAKNRAKNCSFATELKLQIQADPKNITRILAEENISQLKRQTGAKVTNSSELNAAIKSAQKALNMEDKTQKQTNTKAPR